MLRLEKGHVIVGQDTDGLTFPHEAGMEWAIAGRASRSSSASARSRSRRRGRSTRKLVGFTLPPTDRSRRNAAS